MRLESARMFREPLWVVPIGLASFDSVEQDLLENNQKDHQHVHLDD